MDQLDSKGGSEQVEMADHSAGSATEEFGFTQREQRKTVHKIDRRAYHWLGTAVWNQSGRPD